MTVIKFHKVLELFPNRKVRTVRTEQLCSYNDEDLLHSLVNDGVASCLADDEIRPLNDYNGHKERRVTRVLQSLALCVRLTQYTL